MKECSVFNLMGDTYGLVNVTTHGPGKEWGGESAWEEIGVKPVRVTH